MAADASGLNGVNTVDAIATQKFFLRVNGGTAYAGVYQFTPESRSYSPLTNNQTGQNFDAIVFGDVAAPFVH